MSPQLIRLFVVVVAILLVPVIPFVLFGDQLEPWIDQQIRQQTAPATIAGVGILALVADILLPVPSSFVGTFIGMKVTWPVAVAIIWVGQTLGAIVGYGLARWLGQPLLKRFCSPEDMARLEWLAEHHGAKTLLLTRALPVLAEATVLFFGMLRFPFRRFLLAVGASNLAIAVVYATLGKYGKEQEAELWAIAASIVIPVIATAVARWLIPAKKPEPVDTTSPNVE